MDPTANKPSRVVSDADAVELIRQVRVGRSWPRPPAVALWLRLGADACFLGSLATTVMALIANFGTPPPLAAPAAVLPANAAWRFIVPAGFFVCWFVLRMLANRRCRSLRRHVLRGGGLACINCHYPLPVPDDTEADAQIREQLCPECREPYRPVDNRRDWKYWQPSVWFY